MNRAHSLLYAACAALLAVSACDQTDDVSPTTGTLKGDALPWQVSAVVATNDANQEFTVVPPDSGYYYIHHLPPGNYTLSFRPTGCYAAPAPQHLTVMPGDTTEASETMLHSKNGLVVWHPVWLWPNGPSPSALATGGCMQASVQAGELSIRAADSYSRNGTFEVELRVPGFNGAPGTFALGPGTAARLTYGANATSYQWSTDAAGGSGVINITAVGSNPRRISGTFSASVQPATPGARYQVQIQNGTFTDVLY